ncbi:MAG: nucleotidyltransferase domain-containing protein [Nitrospirae bacterium]|nr:MAG: nucleotidyltransferase domain-containing protein [Nitrospirota bacterium]
MRRIIMMKPPLPKDVTFDQINRILEVTDALALDREWIEIPLSAASPGKIHKLPNGKIEIVVDAEMPFDEWLTAARQQLRQVAPQTPSDGSSVASPQGDPSLPTDAAPAPAKDESVAETAQVIAKAVRYVKAKRGGDLAAIILAGSAARDAMTSHSDVDLLVLVLGSDNSHELVRILSRIVEIRYLGVSEAEEQVNTSLRLPIILRKARILYELEAAGSQLLQKAHARFRQGPPPLTIHEKIRLRATVLHWLGKAEDQQADPAIARHLLSIFLDEAMSAFYQLRGFWPASPVEHLRFIGPRDHGMGDLLQQAFTATDLSDQLATARRIADHLFKDIPAPARID